MKSLLLIDVSKYETEEDFIKIRFQNEEFFRFDFSKLFKVSEYLREKYKYSEAMNLIQKEISNISKDISADSIKYFLELVEEEKVNIPYERYRDIYTLSEYFNIQKIQQELDNLREKRLCQDINFTLQIIIDSEKAGNEIEKKLAIKIENLLSNQINGCLENCKFKELSNSTISRIIEKSQKSIKDDLLFEFIFQSASTRFILIKFVSLDKLREDQIDKMIKFIEEQDEETRKMYLDYIPFNLSFIKMMKNKYDQLLTEMRKTKEILAKEEISHKETKEKLKEEEISHKGTKGKLAKEEISHKETKEKLAKGEISHKETKEKLKKEEMKNLTRAILGAGYDQYNHLGEKPNNEAIHGSEPVISPPEILPFDSSSLLSYSIFSRHSILVTNDSSLKGIGYNNDGRIISSLQKTKINHFTDFCIKDDSGHQLDPVSAVCNEYGTLYMFSKMSGNGRQLVLCDRDINDGDPVFLDIDNHNLVALFGGCYHSASICSEGEIIFINRDSVRNSPKSRLASVSLPEHEKASSVACLENSIFVLSLNGRVFESPIERGSSVLKFSEVEELKGKEIVCVAGSFKHVFVVSKEGRVFGRGSNEDGKLGVGEEISSVSSFAEISSLGEYEIRAAYAGCWHSLFQTREGKILSCGFNRCGQLLLSSGPSEPVYQPTETTIAKGATFCIAGNSISVVFIGDSVPQNTPNMPIQKYK